LADALLDTAAIERGGGRVHGETVNPLVDRLEIQHWVERYPEIRDEDHGRPSCEARVSPEVLRVLSPAK